MTLYSCTACGNKYDGAPGGLCKECQPKPLANTESPDGIKENKGIIFTTTHGETIIIVSSNAPWPSAKEVLEMKMRNVLFVHKCKDRESVGIMTMHQADEDCSVFTCSNCDVGITIPFVDEEDYIQVVAVVQYLRRPRQS